jgi:D-alanine transaminase
MFRFAYVNGRYLRHAEALLPVEDRATQFADAVYEVIAVWKGLPVDLTAHLDRLDTGLKALSIPQPMSRAALKVVLRRLLARNRIGDGVLYLQVSRGVAPRNHLFPKAVRPSLVATVRPGLGPSPAVVESGVAVIGHADLRWRRRDIKSVSLLPNVLAKQAAVAAGAFEAFLTEPDGTVTEGSVANAWMVDGAGRLITRPLGPDILAGTTRRAVADLARAQGIEVVERPFTLDEAKRAREVFITSTSSFVLPVVRIDDAVVANGHPGTLARDLRRLYIARLDALTPDTAWT